MEKSRNVYTAPVFELRGLETNLYYVINNNVESIRSICIWCCGNDLECGLVKLPAQGEVQPFSQAAHMPTLSNLAVLWEKSLASHHVSLLHVGLK